ncbi:MAG: hypothetical protein UW55_C0012G0026 [Candidatus Giovannonibacteria bacterium GW2011_GWA2_44_26]|uniref:Holin n=1 Tax=Candidatus Giovannonibacteria bacterium GW2011_GWA2_44_26 TaxID=1618648 RepID=A0A0G1ISS9_9BACT|nr:MAG: hypothetical protein UW55_C0012G0026 [Candidatus Giovannonibacteria bacterium GW2011_GWA2_44_26]
MNQPSKEALKHLFVVFFYSAVSSILPILIAYIQNDPRWALLIPVINAAWYSVTRYLKEQKLIEDGMSQGDGTV